MRPENIRELIAAKLNANAGTSFADYDWSGPVRRPIAEMSAEQMLYPSKYNAIPHVNGVVNRSSRMPQQDYVPPNGGTKSGRVVAAGL